MDNNNKLNKLDKQDLLKYIQKSEDANDKFIGFTTNIITVLVLFILVSLFLRMWGWM